MLAAAYRGLGPLTREMFGNLTRIAVQAEPDANRFIQLGAVKSAVSVCGSLKFDVSIPADIFEQGKQLEKH